jgi:hypothetical protein
MAWSVDQLCKARPVPIAGMDAFSGILMQAASGTEDRPVRIADADSLAQTWRANRMSWAIGVGRAGTRLPANYGDSLLNARNTIFARLGPALSGANCRPLRPSIMLSHSRLPADGGSSRTYEASAACWGFIGCLFCGQLFSSRRKGPPRSERPFWIPAFAGMTMLVF